jgi:hypothetical protein
VGEIQANVLSNGRIQINNFDDANVQADSQFSIAVYQAPLERTPFTLHHILRRRSSFCIRLG